jgi:DNA-binding HxlR family transcriptional regulator
MMRENSCPVRNILSRVGDKWSVPVIILLGEHGTLRFNQLSQLLGDISQKMLAATLKTLESDGLISRKMYAQIPPKVEYTITELGKGLVPALATLKDWAEENMPAISAARENYSITTTTSAST